MPTHRNIDKCKYIEAKLLNNNNMITIQTKKQTNKQTNRNIIKQAKKSK